MTVTPTILSSYNNLRTQRTPAAKDKAGDPAGYRGLDQYPAQEGMNFQATDFPLLAGSGSARMLANNQAFFFIRNPKGNTEPKNMKLDTGNLKKLIGNIYDQNTQFTMMLDADIFHNRGAFVNKYQNLRGEPEKKTRTSLLKKEAVLIEKFVSSGGIKQLVAEVIAEKESTRKGKTVNRDEIGTKVAYFLQHNFKLQGVQTKSPLGFAVWDIEGPDDSRLLARQMYSPGTHMTDRPWQLGTEAELVSLVSKHDPAERGAQSVLDALDTMNRLGKETLTLGVKHRSFVSRVLHR